jgi:4-aminobutyrate aminotransferase-like enzyme
MTLEPENEYLGITVGPAWKTLAILRNVHPNLANYMFREACGYPPHSKANHILEWLKKNKSSFASPIEINLRKSPFTIFDLSIGSFDYGSPDDVTDTMTFTKLVVEKLQQEKVPVALGGYNEARMIYSSSQYASDEDTERRTVHIGLDFYMAAGSLVYAPLKGTVFSLRNNDLPFDYGPTIILEHNTDKGEAFFTLYGHLSLDSIQNLEVGQKISRGQEIARIGEYPTNGGWPPHLHFQIMLDMLNFEGDYYGSCWPSQRSLWTSLCPDPNLILGIPSEKLPSGKLSPEEILEIREESFGRNLSVSYQKPIKMVRGYMQFLYDEDGRQYLDCVNNVPHVGHSHPKVVKAIQDQAKVLYTNTRYLHDNLARYANRLASKLPDPLNVCFFVNSGSEANELAIRLAQAHTGRNGFIALSGAYHGNTDNLVGLSEYKHAGEGGAGPPDNVQVVINPDPYRSSYGKDKKAAKKHADDVKEGIERSEKLGHPVAAFICEPVMSCAGQIFFPPTYLQHVYKHVRDAGGVCIADEVQIGFGRMGTHFWGFETQGVIPDIVTLGKPIGNGHPIGAVVTTREIAESFNNGMEFFSTTGGNTVSCAVGLTVLDVIEEENLQENAKVIGEYLKEKLLKLQEKHSLIGDVRGIGLFLGMELVKPGDNLPAAADEAHYIANRMRDLGVLMSVDGSLHNVLKIKPPLVFKEEDADRLVSVLDFVLSEDFPSGKY